MANELSVTANLQFAKGNVSAVARNYGSLNRTVAGAKYFINTQAVGTSKEPLLKGDIGTIGYIIVKNLDATNFVTLFADNAVATAHAKLLAGDHGVYPINSTQVPSALADTAEVALEYMMVEA